MANWRSYIDPSIGDGQNTIDGIIANGATYGLQISDDLSVTGLSTFSDVARFSSTVRLDGQLRDGDNNFGTSGQVLSSDGTDTRWVSSGSLAAGAASQVAINDDSNTNASRFLTFVDSSSGNNSIKTDPQLTYNPSTNVISTAGIELDDDKEIVFGDNSDLKIYHDPSSNGGSRIDHVGHDDLRLRIGGNQLILEKTSGENFIVCRHNTGAVELCHNNSNKLITTSSGVTITGTATATAFSGPLTGNVTGNISGNAGTSTKLATSRTIGGVSFDGSANINLPGVNADGNQDTTGNAATSTLAVSAQGLTGSPSVTVTNVNAVDAIISGNLSVAGTITSLDQNDISVTGIMTASAGVDLGDPGIVTLSSDTLTTTSTSADTISSISATVFRSATFQVQITRGTQYHMTTINVIHNGTVAFMSEYGTIRTGAVLATFDADINSGNLRLRATPTSADSTVFKLSKTTIKV